MDKIQKITTDYYNNNYLVWAAGKTNSFYHEDTFKKFISYLKPNKSILDIGCAYGIHVPLFLGIGCKLKYSGLDISKNMLNLARSRYPQLSFNYGNITDKKTLPKIKFDGFWAVAVLMHIPMENWNSMLDNIEFLTKSGGIGYITLPNDRPHPESEIDKRYFNLFKNKNIFPNIVKKRGWRIIDSGTKLSSGRTAKWFWYIVKLPKKTNE